MPCEYQPSTSGRCVQQSGGRRCIGVCTGLTTVPKTGSTLPTECRRILVLPCSRIPEIPTACISFRLNPTSFAAPATAGCTSIEPATVAPRGKLFSAACHKKRAYETVLRDAITADVFDPVGIYFGTRSGQLFGSRDEGRTWQKILEGLPSVVCVRNAVVEDGSGGLGKTTGMDYLFCRRVLVFDPDFA